MLVLRIGAISYVKTLEEFEQYLPEQLPDPFYRSLGMWVIDGTVVYRHSQALADTPAALPSPPQHRSGSILAP